MSAEERPRMDFKLKTMAVILHIGLKFLYYSYRWRYFGVERVAEAAAVHPKGSFALGIWHENLLAGILSQTGRMYSPLTSLSKDGEVTAYILEKFGHKAIRGSSSRGGVKAIFDVCKELDKGFPTAITVDGPRGPRRDSKAGIIQIAKRSGAAIVCFAAKAEHPKIFPRSWDQFRLPKPFARIAVQYAEPIFVPADLAPEEFEAYQRKVETTLNQLEDETAHCFANWQSGARKNFLG